MNPKTGPSRESRRIAETIESDPMNDQVTEPIKKTVKTAAKPFSKPSLDEAMQAVETLLSWAGDDPSREGLLDTPKRVALAYRELFRGYDEKPEEILNKVFKESSGYDDMVLVRDISFYSHCEHHMVPFHGKAHIAYYPRDGVVGLSKISRLVDVFSRRFQTQENMTAQIINAMSKSLNPRGIAILIEAEHMCMSMRGVQKQGASTITAKFSGLFQDNASEQARFFTLVHGPKLR
jgi:GTP cyclohydrolase IA